MLIYIPPTSRAGIAVLFCIIAVANLNFFKPHKNRILFWLSQISFVTTTAKYTVALLLSSSNQEQEQKFIGMLLIGLDVGFMVSSVLAIIASLYVLHAGVRSIQKNTKEEHRSVKITPTVAPEQKEMAKDLRQVRLQKGTAGEEYKQAVEAVQVEEESILEHILVKTTTDIQNPKQVFEKFDTDGSGCLDRIETREALRQLGCTMDDKGFEKMFDDCDKDKNEMIQYKEFKKTL